MGEHLCRTADERSIVAESWDGFGTGPHAVLFPRVPHTVPREGAMQDNPLGTTAAGTGSSAETDETDRLISSNKVEGTPVYNRQGERRGSIYNFMVDKRSGQVDYAVLSFVGFLGIGEDYDRLPRKALTYDTTLGGY